MREAPHFVPSELTTLVLCVICWSVSFLWTRPCRPRTLTVARYWAAAAHYWAHVIVIDLIGDVRWPHCLNSCLLVLMHYSVFCHTLNSLRQSAVSGVGSSWSCYMLPGLNNNTFLGWGVEFVHLLLFFFILCRSHVLSSVSSWRPILSSTRGKCHSFSKVCVFTLNWWGRLLILHHYI